VASLVSLNQLDRLSPISPNSLRLLHAVPSLVDTSRRDPVLAAAVHLLLLPPPRFGDADFAIMLCGGQARNEA
jgi:hypothetical protein